MEYRALLEAPHARLPIDPAWLVAALAAARPRVNFIQIGANDGRHDDPLHAHIIRGQWRGVLFEPDPVHFRRLQETYAGQPNLTLVNAAVGTGAEMTFHSVDPDAPGLPGWTRGIGSLLEDKVRQHAEQCPAILPHLLHRRIPTLTIDDAFERLGTDDIDLLLTDVEGYDGALLRQLNFRRWKPRCLYYESRHLPRAEHDALLRHLITIGYLVAPGPLDSVAVLPDFPAPPPEALPAR